MPKLYFEPPPRTGDLALDNWSQKVWQQLARLEQVMADSGKIYLQSDYTDSEMVDAPVKTSSSGKLDPTLVDDSGIDHNGLLNTHNLTSDIDHDHITNTHNLTTDIDHDEILNTHNLTTDINHALLSNLDYANSGHTGFASAADIGDYVEVAGDTMTGNLIVDPTYSGTSVATSAVKSSPSDGTNSAAISAFEADLTGVDGASYAFYSRGGDLNIGGDYGVSIAARSFVDTVTAGPNIRGYRSRGTEASKTVVIVDSMLLALRGHGYYNTTTGTFEACRISMEAAETWDANNRGSQVKFHSVLNGAKTLVERGRIDSSGQWRFGNPSGTDYSYFEVDGTLVFAGAATVWEDLRFDVAVAKVGASAPDFDTFRNTTKAYWFDAGTDQEIHFSAQMPHSWAGTAIYPHVHWAPSADGTPTGKKVSWGLEYSWADIGEVMPSSLIVYTNTHSPADTNVVAYKHYISSFSPITPSTSQDGISTMLVCRLFRDATGTGLTDSYTADAALLEFDIHYEINTIGSRSELAK